MTRRGPFQPQTFCDCRAERGAAGRTQTALPAGALLWGAGVLACD